MFDPSVLLGGMLQGGARGPAMGRLQHATSDRGLGGAGGPLGSILGQLGGGGMGGSGGMMGGGMGRGGSMTDILGGLAGMSGGRGSMGGGGGLGGLMGSMGGGGGGLGGLVGSVLGGGGRRGGMGNPMGAGALGLLGMIAMNALRNSGQSRASGLSEAGASGDEMRPPEHATSEQTATLVLRAMIDAAKADGQIDATERSRIVSKAQENGADQEGLDYLEQEMSRPPDIEGLAADARDPVVAGQVYAASLLAIEIDTPAERDYLRRLADRLGLEANVVTQLHQSLDAPAP